MAVNFKPAQQYEHLLFGSVPEAGLDSLLNRLRGLCVLPECKFNDRILTAIIAEKYKPQSSGANASLKATVRQSLDDSNAPIYLIYNGQLELGDNSRPTAVRTCVQVPCSGNLLSCLDELGFTFYAEMIVRGYLFQKGSIKIMVSKLYQPSDNGENSLSESHLVELSAIAPSGQDNVGNEMKSFAELLRPYPHHVVTWVARPRKRIVYLEKTDGR